MFQFHLPHAYRTPIVDHLRESLPDVYAELITAGAAPMTVKLIAERRTGLLLGAQIVGRQEAAKRIDALAVAIWNRMTVEAMTALDLSYAPPYAPVYESVLLAAQAAARSGG